MLSPGSVLGVTKGRGIEPSFYLPQKARLPTITTVRVPEGYNWKDITAFLMDNHGMEIAGGLGPTVGKVGRVLPSCCPWLGTESHIPCPCLAADSECGWLCPIARSNA